MSTKQEIALRDKSHLLSADIAVKPPESSGGGYEDSLWATGVKVLAFSEFGDYQGTWWARIEFPNGEKYFVKDHFGSCSVCDSFQAEFDGRYVDDTWTSAKDMPDYLHKLRDFGRQFLADCRTTEQALAEAAENSSWDMEAETVVAWIKENSK